MIMTRSYSSIYFSIRESKVRKDGTCPIEVVISINKKKSVFSTGKKVKLTFWNQSKQCVNGNDDESKSLNQFLKSVKAKLYQKETELLDKGFIITADLLRDAYLDRVERLKDKTFLEILAEHNAERKTMIGKGVAPATYWVFEYTERILKEL